MVVVLILLAGAVFAGIWYFQYQAKQKRRAALLVLANQLGLQFSAEDPFGMVGFPFDLFRKGDGRGVENVVSGVHDGVNVRLFDYWYYDETSDGKTTSRTYHRFTCAISEIPADCPHLTLRREGFLSKLADHVGMADLTFESDDFNRMFEVRCSDQRFAFALIDGRMMEWLMQAARGSQLETGGPMVIVATDKLEPAQWPSLLDWERQFREHVPNAVYVMYKAS
ncbi:MAG: hypothetical protein U0V73_13535 [Acidimicrobiia bacterium]